MLVWFNGGSAEVLFSSLEVDSSGNVPLDKVSFDLVV